MHQLSLTSRRRMISLAAAFIAVAMLSGCGAAPPTSPVIDPTSVSGATRSAAARTRGATGASTIRPEETPG